VDSLALEFYSLVDLLDAEFLVLPIPLVVVFSLLEDWLALASYSLVDSLAVVSLLEDKLVEVSYSLVGLLALASYF